MIFDMTKRRGGGTIVPKTINANGVYNAAADNADGYSPVTVNVPTGIQPPAAGWLPSDFAKIKATKQVVGPTKITFYGTVNLNDTNCFSCSSSSAVMFTGVREIDCVQNADIMNVERYTFRGMSNLVKLTLRFRSNIRIYSSICASAASGCQVYLLGRNGAKPAIFNNDSLPSTVTDIYVTWGEGEVADAPWGATNATIHYNYTED